MEADVLLARFVDYIVTPAIVLVFAAGFFLFIWGLVQFLLNLDEGAKRKEGISHMIWGIVGMFIMVSVYGILALLSSTFSLGVNISPEGSFRYNPDTSFLQNIQSR